MVADRIGITQLRDMAGRSERVVADIELFELERIADLLNRESADGDYRLRVEAEFADHGRGFPELECKVSGVLPLNCQRCLELLNWDVQLDFGLAIVATEAELDRVAEKFDAVIADEHGFSLADAVVDELLGSLPLAPAHSAQDRCEIDSEYRHVDSDDGVAKADQGIFRISGRHSDDNQLHPEAEERLQGQYIYQRHGGVARHSSYIGSEFSASDRQGTGIGRISG